MTLKTRIILTMLMTTFLTACSNIPLSTMWKMSKLNPLEMNPAGISIAVITHKDVELKKDAVYMQMAYKTASAGVSIDETFLIQVSNDMSSLSENDKAMLTRYQAKDEAIHIFSLSEETSKKMRKLQQQVRTLKRNGVKGSGSMSVGVKHFCLPKTDVKKVEMDILAKLNSGDGYILLGHQQFEY